MTRRTIMPYGYKYPSDNEIYKGKIKQGELSDVPDGKLYREGLEIDSNKKIKQGDLGSESGSVGKKEKVDKSIFTKAEQRDY
tara:strand:- start:388 stop:633 length:246 start_codon:yes stop_codon:yes gene_type:complete